MDYLDHTLLHSAAKSNDLEAAELLLRERVDIHFKDENGLSPLHILIQKRIEMFNSLYAKQNEEFSNHALSAHGYKQLDEPGAEKNESLMSLYRRDQRNREEFKKEKEDSLNAIRKKIDENEMFINMLLMHKSSRDTCTEDTKLLSFHARCTLKNASIAESLSDQVSDINQAFGENSPIYPGYTALHFASVCNINIVKMLVTKCANLLVQDVEGVTPLDICIKLYSVEEMQSIFHLVSPWKNILFSNGKTTLMHYISSLHSTDNHNKFLRNLDKAISASLTKDSSLWPGYTVLHIAVILLPESNLQMFQDILTISKDVVTIQDSHGATPIHLAFRKNKLKVLELLLKHYKKAINLLDNDNLSHLHISASVNNQTLTRKLLKNEANFNVAYKGAPLPTVKPGWTPLHTAAHTKHAVVARILLERGANLLQTDSRGFTAIHLILGTNYTEKMAQVLFASDQLKECVVEGFGLSHLHVSAWKDKPEVIERLLDLGADIESTIGKIEDEELKKFEGFRPIHVAMTGYCLFAAYAVLLRRGADIFARKPDGSSPLSEVLTGKYDNRYLMPIVELLWSSEKLQQRIEEEMGMTMLHIACYTLDDGRIQKLLRKGVDVNARIRDDSSIWAGYTPLHVIIFVGLNRSLDEIEDSLNLLLAKKADVTLANAEGDTPVLLALKARNTDNGKMRASSLMKHQRDFSINPTNKAGMSHFHVACLLNEVETAKKFLKHASHIDVNQAISSTDNSRFAGQTPLHLALNLRAKKYYNAEALVKTVNLLLKRGTDVHVIDAFGYTPLHKVTACTPTRENLLHKILIDNADINQRAFDGKTPIEILLRDGASGKELKYFVERGCRINSYNPISDVGYMAIVVNSDKQPLLYDARTIIEMMMDLPDIAEISDTGRNAIHNAVAAESTQTTLFSKYNEWLEKLVARGCDIFKQDNQGRTALHLAVKFQNAEAIEGLLDCGADINIVDSAGKSPFSYASEFRKDKRNWISSDSNAYICEILALHLRKLQLVGLQVSKLNAKLFSTVLNKREDIDMEYVGEVLNRQLEAATKVKMCDRFTVRDFLHQTGAVNVYSSLKQNDRDSVDLFFNSSCHERPIDRFPSLESLLKLQYRNALQRRSLIAPAANGLRSLMGFTLPDLCAEVVLVYLTNFDLKNITAAAAMYDDTRMIVD